MKIRALTADQKLLLSLSFSQLVAWGSCYYAYAVLMEPVQAALGISRSTAAGAYSLGLLVMGFAAIMAEASRCVAFPEPMLDRLSGHE